MQLDTDQQDYLGVLLGSPASFGTAFVPTSLQASSSNGMLDLLIQHAPRSCLVRECQA